MGFGAKLPTHCTASVNQYSSLVRFPLFNLNSTMKEQNYIILNRSRIVVFFNLFLDIILINLAVYCFIRIVIKISANFSLYTFYFPIFFTNFLLRFIFAIVN